MAEFSSAELARYSRHFALPEFGHSGQQKLKDGRVVIVGAGGLGSPAALYLTAAGVGTLGLVDFDQIDVTNLQRQIMYTTTDVGERKLDVSAERLRQLNPEIEVRTHAARLTRDNALEVLADYDVVIDGTDNFPTRYLVNDACVLLRNPYVYGSILRFDGQVSVFDAMRGPCYRCLFREPPPPGLVPNCAEGGVLGVLPGVIGSLQALEAIKLIAGVGETLIGRLVLFDALTLRWRELKLKKNAACPMCGERPTITGLIDYEEFCGYTPIGKMAEKTEEQVQETTVEALKERLDRGERPTLLDVREPFEWNIVNLGDYGARMIPLKELPGRENELDRDQELIVYCRSGSRSAHAVRHLMAHGFRKVMNLKGGVRAWAEQIDPSLPTY
jgi:molybdopterin/thiamine biosynthesis adenylyltransferase/rhodanese-related sulfurtransferase